MLQFLDEIDSNLIKKSNELEDIFSLKVGRILVDVLSKEEFKKFGLRDWAVAFANPQKKCITIIKQGESGRDINEWRKVLIHEMVHIFYLHKFKTDKPVWFFEGLACFLADQKKKGTVVSIKELIDHFSECNEKTYALGYNAVKNCLES